MPNPHLGQLAALGAACCWTVTSLSFESAGKRIGSLAVNLIRLALAFAFLSGYGWLARGRPLPTDAGGHTWSWLLLSGFVGFYLGDMTLFRSFVLIGARRAMLLLSLSPALTALLGRVALGEVLSGRDLAGIALTLIGVTVVVAEGHPDENGVATRLPWRGVLLGVGGAAGQAGGLVLSKYGMGGYDAFAATQIRVLAGFAAFALTFLFIGWWPRVLAGLRDGAAMARVGLGAFFGPFLGVGLSLLAVQNAKAGVAATLMSLTPVLLLAPAALVMKERVTARAVAGAAIAVGGVALLVR